MTRVLWTLQAVLALVFLFSGAFKLAAPVEAVQLQLPLPGLEIRLIGTAEVLGALGLILPSLLKIRAILTPVAALCLLVLMTGATVLSPSFTGDVASAVLPLVLGLIAAFIAYGRTRIAPLHLAHR